MNQTPFKRFLPKALPYLLIAPSLLIFAVFVIYPIVYMVYLSFYEWNLIGAMKFIGIGNFAAMFGDAAFWSVLANSVYYMFWDVVASLTIGLALAMYLRKNTVLNRFLQGVVFTPYIVSLVSISFIWMWLMDTDFGLLNYLLGIFGAAPIGWLDDKDVALNALIIVAVWKGLGYNTLILVSALQAIPPYLYEAASLDAARPWVTFRKITLPMLSPTIFFLALMDMIAAFKVFETVNIMTQGGPMKSTTTLVFDIYQNGFQFYKIGYASALGVVLMVIIGICTAIYFVGLARQVHYR